MPARPALLLDVGGTLSFTAPESGTLSAATVTVYDENGTITSIDGSAATVAGSTLSVVVGASVVDEVGRYRARWTYTAGGVVYRRDQLFDVARAILAQTLTAARLVSDYYTMLANRVATSHATLLTTAWGEMLDDIERAGSNPHRIIDSRPLERAHAALTASMIAENLQPSAAGASDWIAWSQARRADYVRLLAAALDSVDWYDEGDDLLPASGELDARRGRTILRR